MKISELIDQLKRLGAEHGDVELFVENEDGHSTWAAPLTSVRIDHEKPWYSKQKRWFIKLW